MYWKFQRYSTSRGLAEHECKITHEAVDRFFEVLGLVST